MAFCLANLFGSGGTEMNAVRTAERLDPSRWRVTVVSMQPDGPMRARYEAAGIRIVHHSAGGSLVGLRALSNGRALARYFARERFDVVHCHDRYANVFCGLAARAAGVRGVLTSKRWWHSSASQRVLNALAFRASHRVLANSDAVASSLQQMERVPASRIVVVPNFLDDAAFAPAPTGASEALRARFGVPADAQVVGCVARLRPVKDHASLLRALALLGPRHPRLHAVLVGDGEEAPRLTALARELGIEDRVHLTGHVDQRDRPHLAFDVSVLCSRHEGFPNSVIEAMAVGRPVVATAVGGIPDAVEDGRSGLLVPPNDPPALAAAIGRFLETPSLARACGDAGREDARHRYGADAVIARLERVYSSMLAAPIRV